MKILKNLFIILLIFISILFLVHNNVSSQVCGSKEECEKLISETEQKLTIVRSQKNTLSSEIQYVDSQIYLTTLKIQNTQQQITDTEAEIETLGGRIQGVNDSLDYLTKLLFNKIKEGYKRRDVPLFNIFLDSESASTLLNQLKYAQTAQENDRRVAYQLQQAKQNFEDQKDLRERKKIELDNLKAEFISHNANLDRQKQDKQAILQITKNNELTYQRIIQQALAEFRAVQGAVLSSTKVGPIKKGEPFALVGNSGAPDCSTGTHLHYEVHSNSSWNSWIDASPYLSGEWLHPLQDPVIITQSFGQTPWSSRYSYSGGIHTGIDMYSNSSDVIRAPADGELYTSSQLCGSAVLNVKRIVHNNGIETFYLHVQ